MTKVRDSVRMSPGAIAEAEKLAKESRKRGPRPKPPVKIRHLKCPPNFNKEVWAAGLKLAGNHPKRLITISNDTLIVVNREGLDAPGGDNG